MRTAKHTSTADEHTLKGDRPAERKGNQGTMEAHSMQRARRGGGGSPKSRRWETRSTNQRRRAKGRRISWAEWGLLSHDGLWRGWKSSFFSSVFKARIRPRRRRRVARPKGAPQGSQEAEQAPKIRFSTASHSPLQHPPHAAAPIEPSGARVAEGEYPPRRQASPKGGLPGVPSPRRGTPVAEPTPKLG